jgi:Mg2+/Co2+ transporter CorC
MDAIVTALTTIRDMRQRRSASFSEQLIDFPGELILEFLGAVVTGMDQPDAAGGVNDD